MNDSPRLSFNHATAKMLVEDIEDAFFDRILDVFGYYLGNFGRTIEVFFRMDKSLIGAYLITHDPGTTAEQYVAQAVRDLTAGNYDTYAKVVR